MERDVYTIPFGNSLWVRLPDYRSLEAEVDRLRGGLERLEHILSPEAMRGDTVIDDAYDVVFRTLSARDDGAM